MEYFAFGETFVEEHRSSNNSPYKFNGKELDEETGWYYYGARYYDPRISVWLSVDPLAHKYPSWSPYNYALQNPIKFNDIDGQLIIYRDGERTLVYQNGNFYHATIVQNKDGSYTAKAGKMYDPKKEYSDANRLLSIYKQIESGDDKVFKNQLKTLEKSPRLHIQKPQKYKGEGSYVSTSLELTNGKWLNQGKGGDEPQHTITTWDFSYDFLLEFRESTGLTNYDFPHIAHEMKHQYDYDIGNMSDDTGKHDHQNPVEIRAVNNENRAREIIGEPARTTYGKEKIDPKLLENPPNNK